MIKKDFTESLRCLWLLIASQTEIPQGRTPQSLHIVLHCIDDLISQEEVQIKRGHHYAFIRYFMDLSVIWEYKATDRLRLNEIPMAVSGEKIFLEFPGWRNKIKWNSRQFGEDRRGF